MTTGWGVTSVVGAIAGAITTPLLTGHGLKDPQTALEHAGAVVPCDPELGAIERAVLE